MNQPTGELIYQPGDGQPGDGQPGDGQPGDGQPGDGQPGDGQPGDGQPGDGQPGDVTIIVRPVADPAAVALLKRTVYGTKGVRYQHTGQETKLNRIQNPLFFHLYRQEKLIGLYCLSERAVPLLTGQARGFYGRYLAIDESGQGNGYGHLLKREALRYVERSVTGPIVFYSYIEEKNTRSLAISRKEGFTSVAVLNTFIVRRHRPRSDPRFGRLEFTETARLLALLADAYRNYALRTFVHIGDQSNYFVLKEGDEIVAGVQANPVCWRFLQMPGLSGWTMMNLIPLTSLTSRYFNPVGYRFVATEGIYLKPGREDLLYVLLESVLTHFGFHSALVQIDPRDSVAPLLSRPEAGWLSGFQPVNTHVMVKATGVPNGQLPTDWPVYVSSFDFV